MHFSFLHFRVISIIVPTFLFYHFQSLIQLMRVILVLSVSQQTEIANVANRLIKILIKIHRGSCHPCHLGFPPHFSHVTLTTPQISTRNPKSVHLPPNQISLPSLSVNPQTKSVHLLSRFEIAIKPPSQTNNPRNIYIYIYPNPFFFEQQRKEKQ